MHLYHPTSGFGENLWVYYPFFWDSIYKQFKPVKRELIDIMRKQKVKAKWSIPRNPSLRNQVDHKIAWRLGGGFLSIHSSFVC